MKQMEVQEWAACEGYRLHYRLLSENGYYLIQCLAFEEGRLISQYCTDLTTMDRHQAVLFFRMLVEQCVFPVHIRDILCDCEAEKPLYYYSA